MGGLFGHFFSPLYFLLFLPLSWGGGGWSGGAMALGNLPVPGRPTIWITVGQGPTALTGQRPTALTVGAGGGCLDIFTHLSFLSSFSLSLGYGPI